jgi:glycosyltransferase involved in cell wall biosynthesis
MNAKFLKQIIAEKSNDYSLFEEKFKKKFGISLLDPNIIPPKSKTERVLSVSVVIPAYNSESSILACLASIEQNSFNINHQNRLQVVVVDDGSKDNTWETIKKTDFSLNLTVLRQKNLGQAQALNTGISVAEGDIIISCDSDMVLGYYAIEHFLVAHQEIPNSLFVGFRKNIPGTDERANPSFISKFGSHIDSFITNDERIAFPTPGWPNNMCLASNHFKNLGEEHILWMPDNDAWLLPDMVIGALFSLSRSVFHKIGGYDERLVGWGCSDGYLAAKAIGVGQYIIPLYAASGLHINHPDRLENKKLQYEANRKLFFKFIKTTKINDHPNWLTHARNRIIESFTHHPTNTPLKSKINFIQKANMKFSLNKIDNLLAVGEYSRVFKTLTENNTENSDLGFSLRLGKALSGMNRYEEAIKVLDKISFSPEAMLELVITLAADGQFKSAKKTLDKLAIIYPQAPELEYWYKKTSEKHIRQGKKFLQEEFYNVALRCFEATLITNPSNELALKYRNQCLTKLSVKKS